MDDKFKGSLTPNGLCSGCNIKPAIQDNKSAWCPRCRVWFLDAEDLKKIRPTMDGKEAAYK